jgi:hypothetical protein
MTTNRKAQLQRKLSMKAVPEPPAGLRERLRNDIPAFLPPKRRWFARPMLQIAASITLLITAVTVTMLNLQPGEEPRMPQQTRTPGVERRMAPVETDNSEVTTASAPAAQEESRLTPEEERLLTKAEASRRALEIQQARERRTSLESAERLSDSKVAETAAEAPVSLRVVPIAPAARAESDFASGRAGIQRDAVASESADLEGAFAAPAAPPSPPPPPPVAAAPVAAQSITVTGEAARARAQSAVGPVNMRLSVSSQSGTFATLAAAFEDGVIPRLSEAQIASLIDEVGRIHAQLSAEARLFYEVSQLPVESSSGEVFLRVVVDLRSMVEAPVTLLEVLPDRRSVVSVTRLGDTGSGSELVLRNGQLTTVLYAIRPARGAADDPLLTVRLHERSAEGTSLGIHNVTVAGADVGREWKTATPPHRLVTLAAALADAVNGRFDTAEPIARLAAELAKEHRNIPVARDLEHVSRALSRLVGGGREEP